MNIIENNETVQSVLNHKRNILRGLLLQCTDKQKKFFYELYPSKLHEEIIDLLIIQCENTVELNNKRAVQQ
jgi:hypothetical protein